MNYKMQIFKKDRRSTTDERLVKEITYRNYSGNAMMDEAYYLRQSVYKTEDGYRVDWE